MPGMEKVKKTRKPTAAEKKAGKPPGAARAARSAADGEQTGNGNLKPHADARGKYVYCIIQASDPLRFGPLGIGVDPAEVHTVNYRDIAAVVSDTPIEVHDPTREN